MSTLIIEKESIEIKLNPKAPLLIQLERAGFNIENQCRSGFCGACKCKLLSGDVRFNQDSIAYIQSSEILTCCSIPLTNLKLDFNYKIKSIK